VDSRNNTNCDLFILFNLFISIVVHLAINQSPHMHIILLNTKIVRNEVGEYFSKDTAEYMQALLID
jgi:hypothetical protein